MDMELFAQAIYDAPELVSHIMDCTGKFSAYIAQVYAEHPSSPLLFMGEDICGSGGLDLQPPVYQRSMRSRAGTGPWTPSTRKG